MDHGPVLGVLQFNRCFKQAPEQFDNHGAVVALQVLLRGENALSAAAEDVLLLALDQADAAQQGFLGQFPRLCDEANSGLQLDDVRMVGLSAQFQGVDGLCGDLPEQLLRRGMLVDFLHDNHHADRYTVCTKRDERVQTNGRLSSKIELRGKHTTTHGKVSRRLLPEFKAV